MKDGVIADFDVTEKMLRYFLKLIIDNHVFKVKPRVIVCVPSGITEVEKRAVRDSALGAGAKEVFMVAEPMAAAIGVGLPVETPTGNMVIDIGGGTTEIAVIALSGIVSDTSIRTGGDELDMSIVQFMRKNYNLLIGEPTAEQIKIQIGSAAPVGEEREMEVKGRDLVSGIPKTVRVHSSEIREAIQEPIQQIVDAVRRALEITPPELASDIVDRGIVMTGGGALIRGLDLLLSQETGLPDPRGRGSADVRRARHGAHPRRRGEVLVGPEHLSRRWRAQPGSPTDSTSSSSAGASCCRWSSMVLPPNLREPVASSLRRSLVAPLVRLQQGAEKWRGAYLSAEREELRRDTLALAAARVPTLESENDRLRQLLGLGSKLQWGFIPAAGAAGTRARRGLHDHAERRLARGRSASAASWSRPRVSSASCRRSIRR